MGVGIEGVQKRVDRVGRLFSVLQGQISAYTCRGTITVYLTAFIAFNFFHLFPSCIMETPVKKVDAKHDKCRLAELVQYHCEPTLDDDGRPTFKCQPIIRVFRL